MANDANGIIGNGDNDNYDDDDDGDAHYIIHCWS